MATNSAVSIDLNLAFPRAGVAFNIKVETPEAASNSKPPSFHLSVTDAAAGRQIPFTVDASPQLADWVRGYTRWLVRANVAATHDGRAITGTFGAGVTPEQVLRGVQDACGMIRQRFELYEQSILV